MKTRNNKSTAVTRVNDGDRITAKPLAAGSIEQRTHEGECQRMNKIGDGTNGKTDGVTGPTARRTE